MLNQENRPLKRPTLGPPDVYAQIAEQKEDKLSEKALSCGFSNEPVIVDEHGTARNDSVFHYQAQVLASLNAIVQKKNDLSIVLDAGKKKPQIPRENYLLVAQLRHKQIVDSFMNALANGSKSFSYLSKKVPIFNKKEEYIQNLFDFSVPSQRAAWYLKMVASYTQSQNETRKPSRRHVNDPGQEWTQALTKYMAELLQKIIEHYGGVQGSVQFLTSGSQIDIDATLKQWYYCDKLCLHLYQEGLLDRQEYLSWAIDLLENTKCLDENVLKIILSHVYQFIKEIVKQYLLCRRLAQYCAKKISQMISSSGFISPRSASPHFENSSSSQLPSAEKLSSLGDIWVDYLQCNLHRSIVLMMCSMIQSIILACPSALIWLNLGEGKSSFIQSGSPLDLLPCHPCTFPMVPSDDIPEIRTTIRQCEIEICRRSVAAELSWSSDKVQQSMTGFITGKLLSILDRLDRYNFDRADTSPAINQLYSEVMTIWNERTSNESYTSLEPLVFLLCDWAITTNRSGDYRPLIVAMLLDKHQMELWNAADNESDEAESSNLQSDEDNIFHDILQTYLDKCAPVLDERQDEVNRRQFANCVALFAELIRLDIFSHDVYTCTLISRGDLNNSSSLSYVLKHEQERNSGSTSVLKEILESDDPNAGHLQNIGNESSNFDPVSPDGDDVMGCKQSRHIQYVTHFPIPQDDNFLHEINQRSVVLFGVGKGRENSKHLVKRVTKDLQRLFCKKCSIDVQSADTTKIKQKTEAELDQLLGKFQSLAYYDQYCIASAVIDYIIEAYETFISKASTHVPVVEYIMFFLDLVESSLNITALIDYCEKLVTRMNQVDTRIRQIEAENKLPMFVGKYTQNIIVYIVGLLNVHLPSLILHPQTCLKVFEGTVTMVGELRNVSQCSSPQRCILFFLLVLYQASLDLRESKKWADFDKVTRQIQDQLCVPILPSASTGLWMKNFMLDSFQSFNLYKFRFDAKFSHKMSENRTSFVNNTIFTLVQVNNFDKVNEIAQMCAEFTAQCSHLSSDWLGVLKALCCSSVPCGYSELLSVVEVAKLSVQQCENIAVFCAVLIARHCFSLTDFFQQVALNSLTRPVTSGERGGESGARLTLYILLRVFKANTSLSEGLVKRSIYIKNSCDLHLLAAVNRNIQISPLLAILKAILVLANTARSNDLLASLGDAITDEDEDEPTMSSGSRSVGRQAKMVLAEICQEDWVREKFLQDPQGLLKKGELKDRWLEPEGGWKLIQLICRGRSLLESQQDHITDSSKQQAVITRILRSLKQWTIRVAWLELQLLHTWQNPDNMEGELSLLLDNIARATIEVFSSCSATDNITSGDAQKEGVWLVAPLIAKLSTDVQGRVLQSAALVLEKSNKLWQQTAPRDRERESSMLLLNHQPFLSLVLTCLKGHDEQREGILTSLQSQLEKFVTAATEDLLPIEPHMKQIMYEALQLRLSLIGGMFDTIQRTHSMTSDWAHLLTKLILHCIVDVKANAELFYTVLDMLSALIHSTLVSDSADSVENSKKPYHVLIKKIKKEIGDKNSESLNAVRQLLPISKHCITIVTSESHGSILDSRGNKIQGFESFKKHSGLQVAAKYKISPWELIEGFKNPFSLCWQWFSAAKVEKKLTGLEDQAQLMFKHSHNPSAGKEVDFLAPPVLQAEDLDATDLTEDDKSSVTEVEGKGHLASSLPVPKTAGGKSAAVGTKRRMSHAKGSTVSKSQYNVPPRYENRMPAPNIAATNLSAHSNWAGSQPRHLPPSYQGQYYNPGQGQVPLSRMPGMMRNTDTKDALSQMILNKQMSQNMVASSIPMANPNAGKGSYPMEVSSNDVLKSHLLNKKKFNQQMSQLPEYEQATYSNAPQYSRVPVQSGYHPQPSYTAPPQPQLPQEPYGGGMMMRQGQQPMMSYSQPAMPRYPPSGQPANMVNYSQPYQQQQQPQYQDTRMMAQGQYVQRSGINQPPSGPPTQQPGNMGQYY